MPDLTPGGTPERPPLYVGRRSAGDAVQVYCVLPQGWRLSPAGMLCVETLLQCCLLCSPAGNLSFVLRPAGFGVFCHPADEEFVSGLLRRAIDAHTIPLGGTTP